MSLPVFELWAKSDPFHPLPCHLADSGNVALALLETAPFHGTIQLFSEASGCPLDGARQWLAYCVAHHDIGKGYPGFQGRGPSHLVTHLMEAGLLDRPASGRFRHDVATARWVRHWFRHEHNWSLKSTRTIAAVLGAHHGDFQLADHVNMEELPSQTAFWTQMRRRVSDLMGEAFVPPQWRASFCDHSVVGMILCGLVVLSDWIASNTELFKISHSGEPFDEYVRRSFRAARKAVAKLGFAHCSEWAEIQSFREMWPNIDTPNALQMRIESLCATKPLPGLAIVEAPMGEGKTEAALYLGAHWMANARKAGFYIALPTAATSNQTYRRLKELLVRQDAELASMTQLVHGTSWMIDEVTPRKPPELHGINKNEPGMSLDWFRPRKRTLLARNGVGTIDQAHMSVLNVKFGFLRLFGLSGKVLIVDEVHAYDAYMSEFLNHLLQWCSALQIPVILLSATLSNQRRQELIRSYSSLADIGRCSNDYPLVTVVDPTGAVAEESGFASMVSKTIHLSKHFGYLGDADRIAELAAERVTHTGGCLGVVANTVASAQAIYAALCEKLDGSDVSTLLFHARFPAWRRQEIEDRVLECLGKRSLFPPSDTNFCERPRRLVVVATQVIEQSLDLDFDELFSELAPIDLLLQRAGRLWRHSSRSQRAGRVEPVMHVFLPGNEEASLGPSRMVYHPYLLRKTEGVIRSLNAFDIPGGLRAMVQAVYDSSVLPGEPLWQDWSALQEELDCARRQASAYLIPRPKPSYFGLSAFDSPPRDEHDQENAVMSYFAVRTRVGTHTRSVLVLEENEFVPELSSRIAPSKDVLRRIYLNSVSIPIWWLKGVQQADGSFPISMAPSWIPGHAIVRFKNGLWKGSNEKGTPIMLVNDPDIGIHMKRC